MTIHPADQYWSQPAADLLRALRSQAEGLSQEEADTRLRETGSNRLGEERRDRSIVLLGHQFASPLVLILVFAAAVSLALGDWIEATIIIAIVCGSAALGFYQEHRASRAVSELRERLALSVRARRDGQTRTVPVESLVPGDVVELSAGNLVPADGVVLDARDFLVVEASLTGESFPVEKTAGAVAADTRIGSRTNCAFLGTSVRSGTATMLVVRTGRATAFGAIAGRLQTTAPETDFARGIRQFGYLLLRVMIVMVVFVLAVNQWMGRPALESLLFAVALAVGLSPELLPAIVSVTLSHGARAMAARGVIVRRLESIENLGSMDILCTDKTGTLTEGVVALDGTIDPSGQPSEAVAGLAYLNAALESGIANPLDAAIVAAGVRDARTTAGHRKIDEIPYDFIRKRLTIVVAPENQPGGHLMITKGAFGSVLPLCTTVADGQGETVLDETARVRLEAWFQARSEAGYRVLALATRGMPARPRYAREDETDLRFEGFLLFFDPPKAEARRTIRDLETLGIRVKVITGDNRHVAAHVASAIGLDPTAMLTGEELSGMRDEALWQRAAATDLFVEVDPQQKERIVRALQKRGHAIGYLGDGINDAPALHAADVGISVEKAVDVARESADVVLLRPDLDVLRQGVEDGRRAFANTLKYIGITTSANFGNMLSMALAAPLLPFLPLAAKQVLLNNFLSDLPSMAIATDNVDPQRTRVAQRWDIDAIRRFMVVFGLISTVFDLATFALLLKVFDAGEPVFQTAWFTVSLLTELAVVLVLRTEGPSLASAPGRLLLWSTMAVAAFALVASHLPGLPGVFGFVPLEGSILVATVLVVAAYILVTELAKRRFFAHPPGPGRVRMPHDSQDVTKY